MKTYRVEYSATAAKQLGSLDRTVRERVAKVIARLATNPLPIGSVRLVGEEDVYRIRIGDWRVAYRVDGGAIVVVVIRIAHRREVYR